MISRRPAGVGERNGFQTGAAGNTKEGGINVWKMVKTHCLRTVLWYIARMAGMSRFLMIGLLLCGACPFSSRADDAASPARPNVDLTTEAGGKIGEGRAAICKFLALESLEQIIWMAEEENGMDEQAMMRHALDSIPEQALSLCPEDFRQAVRRWMDTCRKDIQESGVISDETRRSMNRHMKLLLKKYMVRKTSTPWMIWVAKETGFSPLAGDGLKEARKAIGRLKALKEKLATGEVALPEEVIRQGNQ